MTQITKTNEQTAITAVPGDWGVAQIQTNETEPRRVKVMQATSDSVKQELNKSGELVDKATGLVLGGRGKTAEAIIAGYARYYINYEKDAAGKSSFKEIIPMTSENSTLPRLEGNLKRVPVFEYYCLDPKNLNGSPLIFSFTGASFKHGTKLITAIKNSPGSMGSQTYLFDTAQETWDGNMYYVLIAKPGRKTTPDEELRAYKFFTEIQESKNKALNPVEENIDAALN